MPSPFPGMDPYLEGWLWPDVHSELASEIRRLLAEQVSPRYAVRIEISVFREQEIELLVPDVEVLHGRHDGERGAARATGTITAPVEIELPIVAETRTRTVQVRRAETNELVASLEILSPVNKRAPGTGRLREKRKRLRAGGVHLMEIDLLREGTRAVVDSRIPASPYLITLIRATKHSVEAWPVNLREILPRLPVPLLPDDGEAVLDLQAALSGAYDRARYGASIDYRQPPPPPPLSESDHAWVRALLGGQGLIET